MAVRGRTEITAAAGSLRQAGPGFEAIAERHHALLGTMIVRALPQGHLWVVRGVIGRWP